MNSLDSDYDYKSHGDDEFQWPQCTITSLAHLYRFANQYEFAALDLPLTIQNDCFMRNKIPVR